MNKLFLDIRKPGFEPDEPWIKEFLAAFLHAMVQRGVRPPTARTYIGAVKPAVRSAMAGGSLLERAFVPQWSMSLTPKARKLFSAGWSQLGLWLHSEGGLFLQNASTPDPPSHPIPVRQATTQLLGLDAPPFPRHLSLATWEDVHWGSGDLRLRGRRHERQFGTPRDRQGLLVVLAWVLGGTGAAGLRFDLDGIELLEQQRAIGRLLGPRLTLPIVPVYPGSRISVSQGLFHDWQERYGGITEAGLALS